LALSSNGSGSDIFIAPVQGDSTHLELGKLEPFVATPAMEGVPMFSPDGRWIAYFSNESNVDEIYVRPFPGPGGKSQISNGGGLFPKWSRTGNELFFKGLDDRIMVAGYSIRGDTFVPGAVRVWSPTPIFSYSVLNMWDLTPDGKRIAAAIPQRDAGADTHLTFLLNFLDGLK
jgi:serine/threonine-protein kinase